MTKCILLSVSVGTILIGCGGTPVPDKTVDAAAVDGADDGVRPCPPATEMVCPNGGVSTCDAGQWTPCPGLP
jgi:hypothetical protein